MRQMGCPSLVLMKASVMANKRFWKEVYPYISGEILFLDELTFAPHTAPLKKQICLFPFLLKHNTNINDKDYRSNM